MLPPALKFLTPEIRKYVHPRLLQALPLFCPAAAQDDQELLAWIYSNSLIHDEVLADKLISRLSMNPKIREPLLRLYDYIIRFTDLSAI
ncbi:hypothetical protein GEMRC1_000711 [Eukaryota sp. GEM-RC1]